MGLFDRFKNKKEPDYDPTNMSVRDLKKGFVFEYDLKTWIVEAEYQYDWGDNYFTYEYLINSGGEKLFLSVEEDDELELIVSNKVRFGLIEGDTAAYINQNQKPPLQVVFKGKKFNLENESPGYFKDLSKSDRDWIEFISWEFHPEDESEILTIEQWDEMEFEASIGKEIMEYEISNILPSS